MRIAWLVVLVAALAGCEAKPAAPTPPGGGVPAGAKTLRIAVIPKGTSHEFWKSVHAGAKQAAQELGNVEVIWQGPAAESDVQRQIEIVQGMVLQKVDGIVLAPNHSMSLVEAV